MVLEVEYLPAKAGDTRDKSAISELEDTWEEEVAAHYSILAWRIPWTEEPGGLLSRGLERVGHD